MPTTKPWGFQEWGDEALAHRVHCVEPGIDSALALARSLSSLGPQIGVSTWPVLSALATIGSVDLSTARIVEPHLDALAILSQAEATSEPLRAPDDCATWGVYAASPPGTRVSAAGPGSDSRWTLNGAKPWCSLADRVSHALITASIDGVGQRLFAVPLRADGVRVLTSDWKALGLRDISTGTVYLDDAFADPVGPLGWYLERKGFAWGGVAVAAIWFGAAAAVAGALWAAARRRAPDQIALMHLGFCDAALHAALLTLREAVRTMDDPHTTTAQVAVLVGRTRACVAEVAERVIFRVGHALGPGPLAFDEPHLRRVADLTLYVRQHHAERDYALLGSLVAPDGAADEPRRAAP